MSIPLIVGWGEGQAGCVMTDAELESHISSLAILIERAMAEGDTTSARAWAAARAEAIKARSPAYVERLEQERGLV